MNRLLRIAAALSVTALLAVGCTEDPEPTDDTEDQPADEPADDADASDDSGDPADESAAEPTALELALQEIAAQVSVIRDLPSLEDIATDVVSPAEMSELILELGAESEALEQTEAAQRVLVALRHLEDGADLAALRDDLLSSSVVGLYDPQTGIAYISSDADPLGPAAAVTAAHELLHALQDQHFDLGRIDDIADEDGDAALAFLALVEGDAVIVEEEWAAIHQTEEQRAAAASEQAADIADQLAVLAEAPSYLIESLVFPYVAGERFVAALIEAGGYEAVDAALDDPPTTTLEILDPERYLTGDFAPVVVDPGSAPGSDWEPLLESSFGVFDLLALFGSASSPEAAQGSTAWPSWEGGALEAWARGEETVVAAGWAFDDSTAAATVCEALPAWYVDVADAARDGDVWRGGRDVLATSCDENVVRFALAPDASTAEAALTTR